MRRTPGTVICVVGREPLARALAEAPNVSVVDVSVAAPETPADSATYAREVTAIYERAGGRQSTYAVTVADPLAGPREAWRRRFSGGPDVLEEMSGSTPHASIELPDYYVVVAKPDPDLLLEWYGGLLREIRPSRVVVVPEADESDETRRRTLDALGRLPTGPWWPPVREILDAARLFVPSAGVVLGTGV